MNHLLRELAPISESVWQMLDEEARERLKPALAARKLVDFSGPRGWEHSATNLGRTDRAESAPSEGVSGLRRRVLPVVEMRADFELSRAELRDAERGADDTDLDALDQAAHDIAVTENVAVAHGWQGVITGISEATPHEPMPLGQAPEEYPRPVAAAVERCCRAASRVRMGWHWEASNTVRRSRRPSGAATRCSNTYARSSRDRSCGRRA